MEPAAGGRFGVAYAVERLADPGTMTLPWLHAGHQWCAAHVPDSAHRELYAALVCGVPISDGDVKRAFVETGLIHVLVVSGAHLAFLERLLPWLPERGRWIALVLYCWLTDWGAPVVRALNARFVRGWTAPRGWSRWQTEALASLVTMALVPPWVGSRSFLMSWLCVLALSAPGPRHGAKRVVLDAASCWFFLFPFSLSAPLTVLWNCLVAPTLGHILFPASVLAMLFPVLTPAADLLWSGLTWTLAHGPHAPGRSSLILTAWIWWLPWALNILLIYGEWIWSRARAFS